MLKLTNSLSKKKKQQQQQQQQEEKTSKQTKKKEIKKQSTNTGQPFNGYSEKPPDSSRLFPVAWGYGGHILVLNPESHPGGGGGRG